MKYQSAYIMLTNFLQRDINILTIWKKVGFQMLFKKRGGCHFSNMMMFFFLLRGASMRRTTCVQISFILMLWILVSVALKK